MSGPYELLYTRRAVRDIEALDVLAKKRLARKLEDLRKDPLRASTRLMNPRVGHYRYRVGDYRVIFDLHGSKIVLLRVGHRREIYR